MALGGLSPFPLPLGGTALDGLTAEQHARLAADLAACVRSCPFALILGSSSGIGGNIFRYQSQYGSGLGATIVPTIAELATGDVRITWNPSYEDEYGVAWPAHIKWATVTPHSASALFATVELENARTLRIRIRNSAGALTASLFSLVVY